MVLFVKIGARVSYLWLEIQTAKYFLRSHTSPPPPSQSQLILRLRKKLGLVCENWS